MFDERKCSEEDQLRDWHIQELEEIEKQYPHNISVVEKGPKESTEDWNFNCYLYAFDLHRDDEVKTINRASNIWGRHMFRSEFVGLLLKESREKEVSQREAKDGDLVIYFAEESSTNPEHAGIVEGKFVKSKWSYSNVYKHPTWEIPSSWGNYDRYFRNFIEDDVKERFRGFYMSGR